MGHRWMLLTVVALSGLIQVGWSQGKNDSGALAPDSLAAPVDSPATPEKIAPADSKADVDLKKTGDQFARTGQTDKAMTAYRQWIARAGADSAAPRIAKLLGLYCFAKKQYGDAAQFFLLSKEKFKDPAFIVMLGKAWYYAGKYKETIETLEPLAANSKIAADARKDAYKTIGDAYVKIHLIAKAMAWYGKYLKAGGVKTADIAFAVALSQEASSAARAKRQFEENLKKYPTDYRNFLYLGVLLSKNKQTLPRCAELLKKAAALAGSRPEPWLEIGRVYGALDRPADELAAYKTCLRIDTFNIEARTRVSAMLLKKGETAEALKLLEETHARYPDSIGPMTALAGVYIKTNKAKDALDLLVKSKAAKPKDFAIRKLLFDAYMATGQDQPALEEIKTLIEIKRDNEYLLAYGKLLFKLGKLDEAVNIMQDIRATAPDNIEVLMTLAKILREQKKPDEAIEVYKEIISIDGHYAPAQYERAEVHRSQNKIKWAEQFYQRALQADPKMGLAELGLAKLALVYKNNASYQEHLKKAASLSPDDPVIKQEMENSKNAN